MRNVPTPDDGGQIGQHAVKPQMGLCHQKDHVFFGRGLQHGPQFMPPSCPIVFMGVVGMHQFVPGAKRRKTGQTLSATATMAHQYHVPRFKIKHS